MKNAGKACNNRLYRHIRTFEKIVKNYFVIYLKDTSEATIAAGAHPNTKKVVGDMTKVVNTGKGCTCSGLAR